jgi:septal ring factor EnvC (AmiA/AmiB activator)
MREDLLPDDHAMILCGYIAAATQSDQPDRWKDIEDEIKATIRRVILSDRIGLMKEQRQQLTLDIKKAEGELQKLEREKRFIPFS